MYITYCHAKQILIVYYLIKVIKLRRIIIKLYTRAFEEKDLSPINHLLQLYYGLAYPSASGNLITRLSKINNNKDYYMLLLLKNDKIIGFIRLQGFL
ncbi:hypothetical protein DWB97_09400 [Staphylococcus chromogenes]|nr:hypothetical protein DWB97_09400 [Staphylococcus chromogenes]